MPEFIEKLPKPPFFPDLRLRKPKEKPKEEEDEVQQEEDEDEDEIVTAPLIVREISLDDIPDVLWDTIDRKPAKTIIGDQKYTIKVKGRGELHSLIFRGNKTTMKGFVKFETNLDRIAFDYAELALMVLDVNPNATMWWNPTDDTSNHRYVLALTPATPIIFERGWELVISNTGTAALTISRIFAVQRIDKQTKINLMKEESL